MPALGVAMSEGLLLRWLKNTGDVVATGEPLVEIETDKSIMEIESPAAGVLGPLLFEPGIAVPIGVTMVQILEPGDPAEASMAPPGMEPPGDSLRARPAPGVVDTELEQAAIERSGAARTDTSARESGDAQPSGEREPHRLSPRERRMARERERAGGGEDAGTSEAVSKPPTGEDVPVSALAARTAEVPAGRPLKGAHRDLIAAKVSESWRTIPHFAVTREVNAAAMIAIRSRHAGETGDRPTFTDLMLRALALALRDVGESGNIDVGLAVSTPQGVAVPVLRNVLDLDLKRLRDERRAAVQRARDGRLLPGDLSDPPRSTLSNLGPQGVDSFTGIVALGQGSLLTVGRVTPRPHIADNAVGIRDAFFATLNVDHRALDGDDAASLLLAFVVAAEDAAQLEDEVVSG